MEGIFEELKGIIKGEVQEDEKTLEEHSTDASLFKVRPRVVVFPKDAEDIKALVKFVAERKKDDPSLSLTVRSGGTDMTGGPLTESIVVDVSRHMTSLKEVGKDPASSGGAGYAIVEPGMFYRNFEKEKL